MENGRGRYPGFGSVERDAESDTDKAAGDARAQRKSCQNQKGCGADPSAGAANALTGARAVGTDAVSAMSAHRLTSQARMELIAKTCRALPSQTQSLARVSMLLCCAWAPSEPRDLDQVPTQRVGRNGQSLAMLETLRHLTQRLNEATDLQQAMTFVVRGVKERLAVDACSVYLVDASGVNFVLVATDGFDPRAVGSVRFARGEGSGGSGDRAAMPGQPVRRACPSALSPRTGVRWAVAPCLPGRAHHPSAPAARCTCRPPTERPRFSKRRRGIHDGDRGGAGGPCLCSRRCACPWWPKPASAHHQPWCEESRERRGSASARALRPSAAADLDAVSDRPVEDADTEALAFEQAVADVRAELRTSAERMAAGMPSETHAIFGVYIEMLDDDELFADTLERIGAGSSAAQCVAKNHRGARQGLRGHGRSLPSDPGRGPPGLGRRVLLRLQSGASQANIYPPRCVLVGEEISVARIADVPVGQLAGIVSARGSPYSHAAILARTLGVPAVMGLGAVPLDQLSGKTLLVDGNDGCVYIDPVPDLVHRFERAARQQVESAVALRSLRDLPAETTDGTEGRAACQCRVAIRPSERAGAAGPKESDSFGPSSGSCCADSFPSEDDQYRVYREVLESFAPKPVTMRTLDVGGDKGLPYFPLKEDNAFLGWRGIRLTLDNPGIFLTQLRALLRANAGIGNLRILLPMISSCREVDAVHQLLARAVPSARSAGHPTNPVPLGVMIEVPSAIYQMSALARRVDFFSIGTNDLTQYLLAVDRSNARVAHHFDSLHPAVLRAVDSAARGARDAGRPISVCGEMAGNPAAAVLLMGLGIDLLSMAATSIPPVKRGAACHQPSASAGHGGSVRWRRTTRPKSTGCWNRPWRRLGCPVHPPTRRGPPDNCRSNGFPSRLTERSDWLIA